MTVNWTSPETECGALCFDGISAAADVKITTTAAHSGTPRTGAPPTIEVNWDANVDFDNKPTTRLDFGTNHKDTTT